MDFLCLRPEGRNLFKLRTCLINPHTYVPDSFKRGIRRISSDGLTRKYREKFRLQPSLRLKKLRDVIKKKHNYKPSMSTCVRT